MATLVRAIAWLWMLAGFVATAIIALGRLGMMPGAGMADIALALSFPWSGLIAFLRLGPWTSVLAMAVGIFVNGQILLAAARILEGGRQ